MFIKRNVVLIFILLLAAILRFVGTNPGFGPYHSDEGMGYSSAIEMIRNLNIDPTRYDYPSLVPIIHLVCFSVFFIPIFLLLKSIFFPEELPIHAGVVDFIQKSVGFYQQTDVLFWGRYVTAFFGVLVVLMVYKLSMTFLRDKRVSLVAAFLTAVNYRQVLNSHLALPDIYNAFFLCLSIFLILKLIDAPSKINYLLAGGGVGLYISTKFQIFSGLALFIAHIIVTFRGHKRPLDFLKFFVSRNFLLALFASGFLIILLQPYHLINWESFRDITSYNRLKYTLGVNMFSFYAISYLYNIGIGKFITIAAIFGLVVALKKSLSKTTILLIVIISFFFVFAYYTKGGFYLRNFVTITPLILIFASLTIVFLVDLTKKIFKFTPLVSSILILLITLSVSLDQVKNSTINSYNYLKRWNFEAAHDWALGGIPIKSKVVSHPWDKYPRYRDLEIIPLDSQSNFSLAEMSESGANYAFLNLDWYTITSVWWMNKGMTEALSYWNKPNHLLTNSYIGTAIRELSTFSVASFVKPWQAPEMNIIIVKLPVYPEFTKGPKIGDFSFSNDLSGWSLIDKNPGKIYVDQNTGRGTEGSLKIESGIRSVPVILAASPSFRVRQNKALVVDAWMKTEDSVDRLQRDGVIRIDFYSDGGEFELKKGSIDSFTSSRFFGEGGVWIKKTLVTPVPVGANYAKVILQTDGNFNTWFDDILVYESQEDFEDPRKKEPYIDYRIDNDVIFPYTQGGL